MSLPNKDFILRLAVVITAAISPFIYIASIGELKSLSAYWDTIMQPMFIVVNASTSYFLFSVKKWRISAVLLLLLTAFSVDNYFLPHNIFAVMFFLFNIYPILLNKRIKYVAVPYILSILFLFKSILFAEISAILCLCLAHLYLLIVYRKIELKRKSYTA